MKHYSEPQALNDVAAFHDLFDLPVLEVPTIPESSRSNLRINLLQEELDELKQAISDNDMTEIADALCDLQYVLSGAVLEFGLADKFSELFENVQHSNMSKACDDYETALKTQAYYKEEKDTDSFIVQKDEKYLVYRSSDKKVLKSIEYQATELDKILAE